MLRTQPDRIVEFSNYSGGTGYYWIPHKSTTLSLRTLKQLVKTVENIQIVRKAQSTSSITHVYLFESYRY